jgi:hypothetical protein
MKDIPILLASITVLLISIFLSVFAIVEYKKYKNDPSKNHTSWKKYMFAAIICFILFCGLLAYLIIKKQLVSKHYKFGGGDRDGEDEGYVPFTFPPQPPLPSTPPLPSPLKDQFWMNNSVQKKPDRFAHYTENPLLPLRPYETSTIDRDVPLKAKYMSRL